MKKIISNKKLLINFIFYLFIPLLITGPLLPEILLILFLGLIFFNNLTNYAQELSKNYHFKYFLIFFLYLISISFFSVDKFLSFKSILFYFRFGLFYISIILFFKYFFNRNYSKLFLYLICFLFCFILIDSYIQYSSGVSIFGKQLIHKSRASSFFGNELILGSYALRLGLIVLSLIYLVNQKNLVIFSNFFWLVILLLIVLSGEKNSLGLYFIAASLFCIFGKFNIRKKFILFISVISIILICFKVFPSFENRVVNELIKNSNHGKYIFSAVHDSHYRTALKMFEKNLFFGVGPKQFRVRCNDREYMYNKWSCSTHPHNMYLQLLAETGIFGFLFVLFFFLTVSIRIVKIYLHEKNNNFFNFKLVSAISVFINFFPLSTSGNIFNNWVSFVYFLSIGIYFYSLKHQNYE